MQCHYEVLSVPRDAEEDAIKKSYRKLALKYHPDKNPDNVEECNEKFNVVATAYHTLMDATKRKYYDQHREVLLQGDGDEFVHTRLLCSSYTNIASLRFTGYGDDTEGFYAVYREVFEKIAAEDAEYMDAADEKPPMFGDSNSVYEEAVRPFYGFWTAYMTRRSYAWVEEYDIREAVNRKDRREMEKENKKERDMAKKKRNEQVRKLALFVKKLDPRVQAYIRKCEERAEEIKRLGGKSQRAQAQAQAQARTQAQKKEIKPKVETKPTQKKTSKKQRNKKK